MDFENLVAFLINIGTMPDIKALRVLSCSGLSTPTEMSLSLTPYAMDELLAMVPNNVYRLLSLTLH